MGEEERAAQYLRYVRSGINLQVKNCLNVVNRLMTSKDGDDADNRDRDAALKELRTGLAEYIRAEADLEDSLKALQLLRERMRPLQDNDEEVDVDKMYKEIREGVARTLSEVDVEKHKAMTEFDLKCSRREEGGDTETEEGGEVVATQCTSLFLDPITKQRMKDPVRNRRCGHTYDRETMLEQLRINAATKCPHPGCKLVGYVMESDLEPDNKTKNAMRVAGIARK